MVIEGEGLRILEEAMAKKHIAKFKDLAIRIGCAERSLRGWLKVEHAPSPYYLGKMSTVLDIDAHALFFPPRDDEMGKVSRRTFIAGMVSLPLVLHYPIEEPSSLNNTILTLDNMTAQYRVLQRDGAKGIENGLRGHLASIQATLENTIDDRARQELWRSLSKAQLVARLNVTDRKEIARAKTLNEMAIASAQNSGDSTLLAAVLGHLGHLYLMWPEDLATAGQYIQKAQDLAGNQPSLHGWLSMIGAAIAAKEGNRTRAEKSIDQAMLAAYRLSKSESDIDAFYTDFSVVSVKAFSANSLLNLEETKRARNMLEAIDFKDLAKNRHASAFYDIARSYASDGELDGFQFYALHSIEVAVETNRFYVIPRFLTLAQAIHERSPKEQHARFITDYAQTALQSQWRS